LATIGAVKEEQRPTSSTNQLDEDPLGSTDVRVLVLLYYLAQWGVNGVTQNHPVFTLVIPRPIMPLFRNTWDNQPIRDPEPLPPSPSPKRKTGLFGSRRSVDDSLAHRNDTYTNGNTRHSPTNTSSGGFFSRRSADDSLTHRNDTHTNGSTRYSPSNTSSGGFFSRRRSSDDLSDRSLGRSGREESSILAVRQKVADAEHAERLAGDALRQARNAVREAREHVRIVENEAIEDARRAKLKQKEAKAVGKSMKHLGRYGH